MIQLILFLLLSVSNFTYSMEFHNTHMQETESIYSPARDNNFIYNSREPSEVVFYDQILIDDTLYTLTYDPKNNRSIFAQWDISQSTCAYHFINNCSLLRAGHYNHISYNPTTKMFMLTTQDGTRTNHFNSPTGSSFGHHEDRELAPDEYNNWFKYIKQVSSANILIHDNIDKLIFLEDTHNEQDENMSEVTGLTARIPWSKVGMVTVGIAAIYGIYKFATKKKTNSDNDSSPIITIDSEKIS